MKSLAAGFSPLVTHSLMHVPVVAAADASGLLTTTLQLGQAVGVATFGSVFLSRSAGAVASIPSPSRCAGPAALPRPGGE